MFENRPWMYRVQYISNVPDEEALKLCFAPEDRGLIEVKSLTKSVDSESELTATIAFGAADARERKPKVLVGQRFTEEDIDAEFLGFTPLYTPEGGGDTDIIALTGLAGHPFHSWQHGPRMWLNDFLPNSARNCRILIFGYNASIVNTPSTNILYDLVSDFKEKLQTIQRVPLGRPLVLIGHSLGGLVVKKAVHDINYTLDNVDWINVQSIIFIATPHRGLEDDTLQTMVKGQPSEQLITELHENSPTLRQLRDCFKRVAEDIKILTLFEKQPTNTIELTPDQTWKKTGPLRMMVAESSAILDLPSETALPCQADHSTIAKIQRGQGGPYNSICLHIRETSEAMMRKTASAMNVSTPLHTAAQQNNVYQAKSLLTSGCDLHARSPDFFDMTALDIARTLGLNDMVDFLQKAGAKSCSISTRPPTKARLKWWMKFKVVSLRPESFSYGNSHARHGVRGNDMSVRQSIVGSTGLLRTWGIPKPAIGSETRPY